MQKKYLITLGTLVIAAILSGCSQKEPIGTVEATDYAMSCEALKDEINLVRGQYQDEQNSNTAKNIAGAILTLGIVGADKEKEIMLRERAKNLQLIYAIKQAKGECKELSTNDVKVDNQVVQTTKEIKETVTETKKTILE